MVILLWLNRFLLRRLLELKNKEGKKAAKAPAKPQFKKILPASMVHSASSPIALAPSINVKPSSGGGVSRSKKQSAKPAKVKESHAQQHKPAPATTTAGSFGGKGLNRPQILEPSDLFSSGSSSNSEDEVMDVSAIGSSQRGSGGVRRGGTKADEGLSGAPQSAIHLCGLAVAGCFDIVTKHMHAYMYMGMLVYKDTFHSFFPLYLSGRKKRVRRIQSIPQNDDGE